MSAIGDWIVLICITIALALLALRVRRLEIWRDQAQTQQNIKVRQAIRRLTDIAEKQQRKINGTPDHDRRDV